VINNLNLWLPFTEFEVSILSMLNVAPSQLYPNSWVFVKAFELVCLGLDLERRLGVFFYFNHIKSLFLGIQVSISSQPSLIRAYKNTFFRVRCSPQLPDLMFDTEGSPLFPFYWTQNPLVIKGVDDTLLTPYV
jgi:hypothetical protein